MKPIIKIILSTILIFTLVLVVVKFKEASEKSPKVSFEEAIDSAFKNINSIQIETTTVSSSSDKLDVNKDFHTFAMEGQSQTLTFNKIKKFEDITVGQCLIRFKDCAFFTENLAKWETSRCAIHPIKESFQILDLDLKQKAALAIYWHGTNYPSLIEDPSSLSFKWDEYNHWFLDDMKERAWYQGNCGLIQEQVKRWNESLQEKQAQANPPPEPIKQAKEEPTLKVGECVATPSNCSLIEDKEEWEKDCHPYSKVYKIKKIGNRSYLAIVWYGYEDDYSNLLFIEETLRFGEFDSKTNNYQKVSCKKMKEKYPKGNYSKIFQRNKNKEFRNLSSEQ